MSDLVVRWQLTGLQTLCPQLHRYESPKHAAKQAAAFIWQAQGETREYAVSNVRRLPGPLGRADVTLWVGRENVAT